MLKLLFWLVLCLNAVLFAYGQGLLGSYKASAREPQRVRNQLNTDKLILHMPAGAALVAAPAPAAPAAPAAAASDPLACTEVGNFNAAQARRFDQLIAPLALGERQTRQDITVSEITSYMVMIPPLGSKDAAERKAAELKAQGVSNYFILNESTPTKWAISLGVFKAESAAQTQLAQLKKEGVTGARVAGRTSQAARQTYRFRDLDAAARAALAEAVGKFDDINTRPCK
ncbi:SPOR domain-containing protein [Massilia sp. PAMC28688]|uniref:SPOR domain-containing protein n=1 Tax=Massilia sp. PAMC28688 TaxID=2861283 RepID=UPI001C6379A1|nr:SPOR domain-containing protein [Massilia sp. PAMC28688]QYF94549.1 SPOR domain-containing protein [Massilia sp. PAMC28688]